MPNIKLKGQTGEVLTYEGVERVYFDSADKEGEVVYYTHGKVMEDVTIEPDFSEGDQVISVPDGSLVKEATIVKPATLVPENIRAGTNVAGVVGELIGDTEEVTVDLDMAEGGQVITPSADGKVMSKVTVTKPETMLPENIRKGIDIGGVPGEYVTPGTAKKVGLDFADYILANTPDEMAALLTNRDNIGKYVKYAGETGEYVSGQYYKVIDEYAVFDPDSCPATATEVASGTTLTATLEGCKVGDLVVAAFVTRSALVSLSDGWTLISTSQSADEINPYCTTYQTLSFAYKYAASTTEELTVTQASSGRIYINMVSLSGATGCTDTGYQYQNNAFLDDAASVSVDRPEGGLILWGATRVNWKTNAVWVPSNDATVVQSSSTAPRLLMAPDKSEEEVVTFATGNINFSDAFICGALSVELEQAMYLIEDDGSEVPLFGVKALDADGDERWNNVTINKPETLLPENIAQGVNIGGVVGTHKQGDHCITYMSEDGSEVLYVKPVMYGDTCGDALALGLFDAPTKETDEPEEYVVQWATSVGGEVDSTVFDAVTEDRTVYAVFKPVPVVASGTFSGGAKWSLNENGAFFVYGEGAMDDYATATSRPWADYLKNIKTVQIKSGVTHVSAYGFNNCSALATVNISDGVTSIGKYAFAQCGSLKNFKIPGGITSISEYMLYGCTGLADIVIPYGVTSIASYAFWACTGLSRTNIPGSVTSIDKNAFNLCNNLAIALFEDTDTWYVGASAGDTTTQVDVKNAGTAATYLRTTHLSKYWTKV